MEGQTSSDVLREEIITQSKAEATTILEQAEKETFKIIKEAEKQAEKITNDMIKKAGNSAENIRRRILSGVHLEVRKRKLRSRETIIEHVFLKLSAKLNDFRHEKKYQIVLENLVLEGILAVDGETIELECGDVEKKYYHTRFLRIWQSLFENKQNVLFH